MIIILNLVKPTVHVVMSVFAGNSVLQYFIAGKIDSIL